MPAAAAKLEREFCLHSDVFLDEWMIPSHRPRKPKRRYHKGWSGIDDEGGFIQGHIDVTVEALLQQRNLEDAFLEEATKWHKETMHLSSPLQRMSHGSYQAVMGMASKNERDKRKVISLMLRDLKTTQRDWFLALSFLTQHNPIDQKDYGKPSKMTNAWLAWGKQQGFV